MRNSENTKDDDELGEELCKKIIKIMRKYHPRISYTALISCHIYMIEATCKIEYRREYLLRLSRHFLEISKLYKGQEKNEENE